jgi:hypothetical protein
MEETQSEQLEARPAEHLALEEFEAIDLALGLAV